MRSNKIRNIWLSIILIGVLALMGCNTPSSILSGESVRVASTASTDGDMGYTIHVNGSGAASAAPDVVDVRLGVETTSADADEAISENTERMNAVLEAVKALDVAEEDIQTVNYAMSVEQIRDENGRPADEVRYHVHNQISVRLRDTGKTGQLLEAALEAGANTVSGVNFNVEDATQLQSQARSEAIANARAKAEELAEGLGVEIAGVRQVQEYSSNPRPVPAAVMDEVRGMGGEVPISGGTFTVSVEVQVIFDIAR